MEPIIEDESIQTPETMLGAKSDPSQVFVPLFKPSQLLLSLPLDMQPIKPQWKQRCQAIRVHRVEPAPKPEEPSEEIQFL